MLSHCLKCRKKTNSKNQRTVKTKNEKIMALSNRAVWDRKKLRFIKQKEAKRLLGSTFGEM